VPKTRRPSGRTTPWPLCTTDWNPPLGGLSDF
jgi:hypothetical protein